MHKDLKNTMIDITQEPPNSLLRRWTQTAIDCYERNCICEGCIYKDLLETSNCQMKRSVFALLKKLGKPNDENTTFCKGKYGNK